VKTLTVDFETYYDKDYSLSKMQTDEYILDDKFEVIGVCVAIDDEEPQWFTGTFDEIHDWLWANFDWGNSAVRAHNTMFDGFILTQRFGIRPKLWMDTLAQARMLYPHLPSHSLANMAKYFNLPDKGTAVLNALGFRRKVFTDKGLREYGEYCSHDTVLCRMLGERMDPFTPALHARLIDMTVRMFTEPMFVGDYDKMQDLYEKEVNRKEELLADASTTKAMIMSGAMFANLLEQYGVTPPTKISKTTGKPTLAMAKSDKEFTDLLNHPDSQVQALVAARLGVKTTIAETRAAKFVQMSKRGPLPVFLNFWGAKTTGRYSGGNQVNWQNLPARGISAGLRDALLAPEGYSVLVGDSSNIELRTVMALAGQTDILDKLSNGVDLYCDFASKLFGRTITKADKAERFLGKTAMLGLQYGAGAPRFQEMVRLASRSDPSVQEIDIDRAMSIVELYRQVHPQVVELWRRCHDVILPDIANGCSLTHVDVNGWFITQNDGFGRPGEPGVVYKDLQYEPKSKEWTYQMGKQRIRIYGPKIVENLSQHAAMLIVMWQTARINERLPIKLSVHDEAVTIVNSAMIDEARAYMEECLSMAPKWCRDIIPVACETGVGRSYGDAK
jgi:hypothetical protein